MKDKVISVYSYLLKKTMGQVHPKFTKNQEKMLDKFLSGLTQSHGDDWLWNYMCYQFSRYEEVDKETLKDRSVLGWVIGPKAIERYKNLTKQHQYYVDDFIVRHELKNFLKEKREALDASDHYQRERKRFYGTERGLVHCKENDLYDKDATQCKFCKFKAYCS